MMLLRTSSDVCRSLIDMGKVKTGLRMGIINTWVRFH